ncbi:MAG: hypothetical protein KDC71_05125 [Acidobacteria bacterium]|nr:hypothetical protein [Acidobacteriota bacterium]
MRSLNTLLMILLLVGCSAHRLNKDAQAASDRQQWDQAAKLWQQIVDQRPHNTRAQINAERARLQASLSHLQQANFYFQNSQLQEAAFEVQVTLGYDPHNQIALDLAERIREKMDLAKNEKSRPEPEKSISSFPALEPSHWDPIDLIIPKPQDVRQIYTMLGRNYGINVLVDSEIKSEKLAVELRDMDFIKALDTLLILNRHFFKVVDSKTIIILKDNKQNRDRYDNQIVKTYYLSNVTPKELKEHLRTLGDLKEFGVNEELNAISIKGTPDQIALADRIIAANDKSLPEVVIEVELLEVNKSAMREVGLLPVSTIPGQSPYAIGITADPADRSDDDADQGGLRGFFPKLNSNDILTILPAVAINFLKETGDSKQVANPHIRVTAGNEASILIGQQVPTATTAFTPIGTTGTNTSNQFGGQPLTTFNYQDVGINLKITPRVHHNDEVTLKMDLEVSSVLSSGLQPTFGKRKVSTTIRLKNGETNVLAGLLSNDERRSLSGIAGLSDIPILGRLFSNDDKVIRQTDIVLTLKPVIVRGPNLTESDFAPYEIGSLSLSSLFRGKEKGLEAKKANKQLRVEGDSDNETPETEAQPVQIRERPQPKPATPRERIAETPTSDEDMPSLDYSEAEVPPEETGPENPAMLAFSPALVNIRKDQIVDVQVFLANASGLQKGEIAISFPTDLLAVEAVDPGDLGVSPQRRPLITPAWNHDQGRISLIISGRAGTDPFSGSGILANLRFRAIQNGASELRFDQVRLIKLDGTELGGQGLNAAVEIDP